MNIRFAKDEIRVRISEEEFNTLTERGELLEQLNVTGTHLYCKLLRSTEEKAKVSLSLHLLQIECPAVDGVSFQLPECATHVKLEVDIFRRS